MAKEKDYVTDEWKQRVDDASVDLMELAISLTSFNGKNDAVASVAAIVIAAGRASGFSGLPLETVLDLLLKQYKFGINTLKEHKEDDPEDDEYIASSKSDIDTN